MKGWCYMAEFMARQGDIFFRSCKKPNLAKLKKKIDNVLAAGEITGHHHAVKSHTAGTYDSYVDEKGDIYMFAGDKPIEVGHDEHNIITIPQGQWVCVSRQVEFDPLAENKKRLVAD
jgi:hypothetical protein